MRLRARVHEFGKGRRVVNMKDDSKKTAALIPSESFRGRSFPSRVVSGLWFVAAVCIICLWAFSSNPSLGKFTSRSSRHVQFGPKRMTPEELKAELAEIDRGMQEFLNNSKPFTKFGPPVIGWDETRADAIRRATNSSSGVNPRPRIMIITSSHPKKCENKQGDQMLLKSIKNKMDYARIHGIEVYYNMDMIDDEMTSWWVKTFLTHMLMKQHPEIDWFWWMDADAIFTDMTFELPLEKYKNHNMVMHGWDDAIYDKRSWLGLNAGVFLLRNCQWSMDMLHAWAPMSPKGKIRDGCGVFQTKALPDRGKGEADDQSGLAYLMITNRERWGSKIYLEADYWFQGYWRIITERFEDIMAKYKPGDGGDRWPFVTHFCGCEFCCGSINAEYTVDQCLTHMERAVNFADNQVIGRYGFRHKTLKTPEVQPLSSDDAKNQTMSATMKKMKKKKAKKAV